MSMSLGSVKGVAYRERDQLCVRQLEDAPRSVIDCPLNQHSAEAGGEQAQRVRAVLPSIPACPTMDRCSA